MKTPLNQSKSRGFTLVELLVVIVIIAVLATLGFSMYTKALHRARMVTALAAAKDVADAVEQFYSEYHVLPDPTGSATEDNTPYPTNQSNGITLLEILCGFEDDSDDAQNDRKIRFLGVKEAEKGNRGGIVYNDAGDQVEGLFDPWGEPFYIILDYDYDNRIVFNPSTAYSYTAKLNGKHVGVYSLGTDSPSSAKREDLVKTW